MIPASTNQSHNSSRPVNIRLRKTKYLVSRVVVGGGRGEVSNQFDSAVYKIFRRLRAGKIVV